MVLRGCFAAKNMVRFIVLFDIHPDGDRMDPYSERGLATDSFGHFVQWTNDQDPTLYLPSSFPVSQAQVEWEAGGTVSFLRQYQNLKISLVKIPARIHYGQLLEEVISIYNAF